MFLSLLLLPQAALCKPRWSELDTYGWSAYKEDFGKEYGVTEEALRRVIFEERLADIIAFNKGAALYKKGVNAMTDMTDAERQMRLGRSSDIRNQHVLCRSSMSDEQVFVRGKKEEKVGFVDWREKEGVISAVKDQGSCGSCWAFASTESVESYVSLATGESVVLSPQQLVSCATNPYSCGGVGGCEGSIPELAFNYVQLYGQSLESSTPYLGVDQNCSSNYSPAVQIDGYKKLNMNDADDIIKALMTIGPLAVNVDASIWHDYDSGILDDCRLSDGTLDLNHVVQLVGYGYDTELSANYWIIRNSWASTFGEDGYIRLLKANDTDEEACYDDFFPLDGTGCNGGPPVQHVCGTCGVLFDASYPIGARLL